MCLIEEVYIYVFYYFILLLFYFINLIYYFIYCHVCGIAR